MAYDFHYDRNKYFHPQYKNTTQSIIPFIESVTPISSDMRILEIGCRDGGVLKRFLELGCNITGFDLEESPVLDAKERYKEDIENGKAQFSTLDESVRWSSTSLIQ